MIKKQINKASAVHNAQIAHTSYRGVEYNTRCVENKESHGTFCYRGQTYTKWDQISKVIKNPLDRVLFYA
jgi:hypothetical protein